MRLTVTFKLFSLKNLINILINFGHYDWQYIVNSVDWLTKKVFKN